MHSSGCWFIREYSLTWATLVSATSAGEHPPRRRGYGREHHLRGLVQVHVEELLEHVHHEIHRGVVIIEQHHLVERRRRYFRARRFYGNAVLVLGIGEGLMGHPSIIEAPEKPASASPQIDGTHGRCHNYLLSTLFHRIFEKDPSYRPVDRPGSCRRRHRRNHRRQVRGAPPGQLGYTYEVDEDGDYRMVFDVEGDRTQMVYVRSAVEDFGDHNIREIWSPAYNAKTKQFPVAVASRLLEDSQDAKMGGWVKQDTTAMFVVKIDADATPDQLSDAIDAAIRTADAMELELTKKDEF